MPTVSPGVVLEPMPPFEPEEFYDEHVNRAEQSKELAELRCESIPGSGPVLNTFLEGLKPVLDKGAELRAVWNRIQGELKAEYDEERAHREKERQIASGEDKELERLRLDQKRAENVLAKQKKRIDADLKQVELEVAHQTELSEREHAAAEEAAKDFLDGIQRECDERCAAFEADQKVKKDAFKADMDEQISSVQKDIAEEAAEWQAEQDRLAAKLESLKVAAVAAEEPVAVAKSNLAEATSNLEIAMQPVNKADDELQTHMTDSEAKFAAMQQEIAQKDKQIADDELTNQKTAAKREKEERAEEEAEQQALFEDSDIAFAEIEATRKANVAEMAKVNASLADDDAAAEKLKEAMDAAAVEMQAEEDKLMLMRSEHSTAQAADDAKAVSMDKGKTSKILELKDLREQTRMGKVSEADAEQARILTEIEEQEITNNANARENARKLAKERETIVQAEAVTKDALQVLTVSQAEADFENGKEEEAVAKEQKKYDSIVANWDERNEKWNKDLDGSRTDLDFVKEQLKTIIAEDAEYAKKLADERAAQAKAISNAEKENRQKLIDERKEFSDMISKESVKLVQEDLDEMNRITLGRSTIEEATVAREKFEQEFAEKLDATAAVQDEAEASLVACERRVKAAAGQEQLEEAKAKAAAAAEARAAMDAEQAAALEECNKRVEAERRRLEEQIMFMRNQFSESKTAQSMNLFERVSRYNSRLQLGSTELETAKTDIMRRKIELEQLRANLADAVANWPALLQERRDELEKLRAEEAAVPEDDSVTRLDIRTRCLAMESQMATAVLDEPARAIRIEEAAIATAEKRLERASEAEAKWSEAEGLRLGKAEDALKAWSDREEARIAAFEKDAHAAISAMEVLTQESMDAEIGIADARLELFNADRAEAEEEANVSLAETSAVSAELSGLRQEMSECFTIFKDEEFKFEKQSREIEKDNAKQLRALDLAEKEKEKRIVQKKADLEQKKRDGEVAEKQREVEMQKQIKAMYAELETAKAKDAEDLDNRKARPAKKQKEVDACKAALAQLEERYHGELSQWEAEKKKLDALLAAVKGKRDDTAAKHTKLVSAAQAAYDKALAKQTSKEEVLVKHTEEYKRAEEDAEAAVVQAKLDEVEMMKKRMNYIDEDMTEMKSEHDEIIAAMESENQKFREQAAAAVASRAAADAELDAHVQPFRDSHLKAKALYTEAADRLRQRREEAKAAGDARMKAAEDHAKAVQTENMRKSDEAARRAEDRADARAKDAGAANDAIADRRARLSDEIRAAADYQQESQVRTAELTAILQLRRNEVEPEEKALANANKELEVATIRLETARANVVDVHPKNVARAEKTHAKDAARLYEEKRTLQDELAAGLKELDDEEAAKTGEWKADATERIAARRKQFDDKLTNSKAVLDARLADFKHEADLEVKAIQDEIAAAEASAAAAMAEAAEKREARETARQKARVDAKAGRVVRVQVHREEYHVIEQLVAELAEGLDGAEFEFEEAMVGLEAKAQILLEEEFERERQRLAEEVQEKKREMAAAIAAERQRAKDAEEVYNRQQERAIAKMEAEAAAERARVAAEMASMEAERLMLEAEAAEIDYAKGEVQLRELSANLLNVPTKRPSSAKGKVGSLKEEIAAAQVAEDHGNEMTAEELAVFEEEKRRLQIEMMLMDQELANLGR